MSKREALAEQLCEARRRTLDLVGDLSDQQMLGPRLKIVNPPLWEIGHCAWFQERWILRHLSGLPAYSDQVDRLYDSSAVAHDTRWQIPIFNRRDVLHYMQAILDQVLEALQSSRVEDQALYFFRLALFHEDMHTEAFTYTRQTLGYPEPQFRDVPPPGTAEAQAAAESLSDKDINVAGREFLLGSPRGQRFVFDNEQWAHPVRVEPFQIACRPANNREFQAFVEEGGYRRAEFWEGEGRAWRDRHNPAAPLYWQKRGSDGWFRRLFDRWIPLHPQESVIHVNRFEAEAFCKWAKRRLPTEAEWELAAAGGETGRPYPWGEGNPEPGAVLLDWIESGKIEVEKYPGGDSPLGCRQLIGGVWEWTSSDFLPYPGFAPGPYRDYSQPWFHTHAVLRGGSWATRSRLIRNQYRNFYAPDRRDVFSGFRTCALSR